MAICQNCKTKFLGDVDCCEVCGGKLAEVQTQELDMDEVMKQAAQRRFAPWSALVNPHARAFSGKSRACKLRPKQLHEMALIQENQRFFRKHRKPELDDEAVETWNLYLAGRLGWTKGQKDGFLRRHRGALTPFDLHALVSVEAQPSTHPRYRLTSCGPAGEAEQAPCGFNAFKRDIGP